MEKRGEPPGVIIIRSIEENKTFFYRLFLLTLSIITHTIIVYASFKPEIFIQYIRKKGGDSGAETVVFLFAPI